MTELSRRSWLAIAGAAAANRAGAGVSGKARLIESMRGVHNFMVTPFRANLSLDAEGLRRNIAFHAASAPPNMTIVVGGGLGELFTLDVEEQRDMAQAAVAGAMGKLPTVVGAGGGYGLAMRMARNAEEAHADAILLFSPPYGSEGAEGAYQYFHDVAASVRIGVIAYPHGKEDYWPAVLKRLAALPNVIGFKDGSSGIAVGRALGELIPNHFLWISEGETSALEGLPAGARAYTTAVATFVPRACHEFWRRGVAGDVAGMKDVLEKRINPVVRVRDVRPGYGISGIKAALESLGRAGGPVRPPGTQVAPEDRPKIAELARKNAEHSS